MKRRGMGGRWKKTRRDRFTPNRGRLGWARKARELSGVQLPRQIESEIVACAGFGGFTAAQVAAQLGERVTAMDEAQLAALVVAVHQVADIVADATGTMPEKAMANLLVRLVAIRAAKSLYGTALDQVGELLAGHATEPAEPSFLEGQVAPGNSCMAGLPVAVIRFFVVMGSTHRFSSREIYYGLHLSGAGLSDRSIRTRLLRLRDVKLSMPIQPRPTDAGGMVRQLATEIADYLRVRTDLDAARVLNVARLRLCGQGVEGDQ